MLLYWNLCLAVTRKYSKKSCLNFPCKEITIWLIWSFFCDKLLIGYFWHTQPMNLFSRSKQLYCLSCLYIVNLCIESRLVVNEQKQTVYIQCFHIFSHCKTTTKKLFQEILLLSKLFKWVFMHYVSSINSCPIIFNLVPLFGLLSNLYIGKAKLQKIIGIQCDETAKIKHKECFATNIWLTIDSTYQLWLKKNYFSNDIIVFSITWKCEQCFSAIKSTKTKSRNCFTSPFHDSQCVISAMGLCIKQLVQEKPSH